MEITLERACHVAEPPPTIIPLPIPQEPLTILDAPFPLPNDRPLCPSFQLKRTLTTLHLQTLSTTHAAHCVAKLAELTNSHKPEVARRACMTLLKLAHLDATRNLVPDSPDIFDDSDDEDEDDDFLPTLERRPSPWEAAGDVGTAPPGTMDLSLAWTLPPPPPPVQRSAFPLPVLDPPHPPAL